MSKTLKLAASGVSHCKRIMRGDKVVAMATQLANGDWCVSDLNDRKISPRNFNTAHGAKKWAEERGL